MRQDGVEERLARHPAGASDNRGRERDGTVDDELLTATLRSTFQTLGNLAFSPDTVAGATYDTGVTGLEPNRDAGRTPTATGTLTFSATFDPGDGTRTARASVQLTCTLIAAP